MALEPFSAVGGASAPVDGATPAPKPVPATTPAPGDGAAFGDALKVARREASAPAPRPAPTAEARARAKELGLVGDTGAADVLGHRYARIEGGEQDGRYVNTSGNARTGQVFEIVRRGGHVYHVYEDRAVRVRSEAPAPAKDAAGGSAAEGA